MSLVFRGTDLHAQEIFIPPVIEGEPLEQNTHGIYENIGQIIDTDKKAAPQLKYYTLNVNPGLYFFDEKVSYLQAIITESETELDTTYRVDMIPSRTTTTTAPIAMQQTQDYLNYYLPHCPNGITDVRGFSRIVYPNYYEGIDLHYVTSNSSIRMYFVVHPGYPADIYLRFQGQDLMNILATHLELEVDSREFEIPNAQAFEYNGNNTQTTMLGWQSSFQNFGSGEVKLNLGNYNNSNYLILAFGAPLGNCASPSDNLEWATFYGNPFQTAFSLERFFGTTTTPNGEVYTVGSTADPNFPTKNGSQTFGGGGLDATVVKFNSSAERQWATFIGGARGENALDVAEGIGGEVYVVGSTESSNTFPVFNGGFPVYDDTWTCNSGGPVNGFCSDNFIVRLTPNGTVEHSTFFGDGFTGILQNNSSADHIEIDGQGNIFIAGVGNVLETGSNTSSVGMSFVSEFSSNFALTWSTQFGASNNVNDFAAILGIAPDNNGQLFVYGRTSSSTTLGTPIGPTANSYTQTHAGSSEAFIVRYSSSRQVDWRTYYGGSHDENDGSIELDANGNLFAFGSTLSSDLPVLNEIYGTLQGGEDLFLLKFTNDGVPLWMTYYGFGGDERAVDLAVNSSNDIYFVGQASFTINNLNFNPIVPSSYFGSLGYLGEEDVLILGFRENNLQSPYWQACHGWGGDDFAFGTTMSSNDRLYIAGNVHQNSYSGFPTIKPFSTSYCEDNVGTGSDRDDAFLMRFNVSDPVVIINTEEVVANDLAFKIFPNPTTNEFTIQFGEEIQNDNQIIIYDILGKAVANYTINKGQTNFIVNTSDLTSGVYFVSLSNGKQQTTQKLIINRN